MRRPAARTGAWLPFCLVALSACAPKPPEGLKLGCLLSLTGKGETIAQDTRKGIDLAVSELNAGRFKDSPVEIYFADTGSDPARALKQMQEMVEQRRVPAVIGLTVSDEVLAAAPLANQRKVVLLSTNAAADDIRTAGDFVFRLRESAAAQVQALASGLTRRLGKAKTVILYSTSANGVSYRDEFSGAMVRLGAPLPSTLSYEDGMPDYRAVVEAARAKAPDAVFIAGFERETGLLLKAASELGFRPQFAANAGSVSARLIESAGAGAEGLLTASARFDPNSTDPTVRAFANSFRVKFGEPANRVAANGYDAVMILADLFHQGAKTADEMKSALYGLRNYLGAGGVTSFDADGEVTKPIALYRVENGKLREVP